MAIPITHRVDCNCVLKPEQRQFAVAPHNGILSESYVSPGDVVTAGQLLARMDDKELQLEKVDLVAQRQAAMKQRDVNRSAADPAATKIAEMKVRQIDAKLQLVNHRLNHLDIKATSDGVVLKGDLEDAQGAPVRTGDVLMEIAAMDRLELEVEVPASQIAWVKADQSADIVLDGNPFDSFEGVVSRIRPESEVREHENVFVAEITLNNPDQLLRPGMKGRAKVKEGLRPIGWILFHGPCERVYSMFR
jgi:multidrug resistance efflux pump